MVKGYRSPSCTANSLDRTGRLTVRTSTSIRYYLCLRWSHPLRDHSLASSRASFATQGQACDFCDPTKPSLSHNAEYAIDGTDRWWQSPPLSRGVKYNEVNVTIDLGQVRVPLTHLPLRAVEEQSTRCEPTTINLPQTQSLRLDTHLAQRLPLEKEKSGVSSLSRRLSLGREAAFRKPQPAYQTGSRCRKE